MQSAKEVDFHGLVLVRMKGSWQLGCRFNMGRKTKRVFASSSISGNLSVSGWRGCLSIYEATNRSAKRRQGISLARTHEGPNKEASMLNKSHATELSRVALASSCKESKRPSPGTKGLLLLVRIGLKLAQIERPEPSQHRSSAASCVLKYGALKCTGHELQGHADNLSG